MKKILLIIIAFVCLFFVVFGSVTLYLSYNFFSNIDKILEINAEKKELQNKLASLQEQEAVLNSDIKKLKDPEYVARYAINKMFKNKLIIIPGLSVKMGIFFSRFLPIKLLLKISYNIQKRKDDKKK